jgi:hypothetical protein
MTLDVRRALERVIAAGDPHAYEHFITPRTWATHLFYIWLLADAQTQAKVCQELERELALLEEERK